MHACMNASICIVDLHDWKVGSLKDTHVTVGVLLPHEVFARMHDFGGNLFRDFLTGTPEVGAAQKKARNL